MAILENSTREKNDPGVYETDTFAYRSIFLKGLKPMIELGLDILYCHIFRREVSTSDVVSFDNMDLRKL